MLSTFMPPSIASCMIFGTMVAPSLTVNETVSSSTFAPSQRPFFLSTWQSLPGSVEPMETTLPPIEFLSFFGVSMTFILPWSIIATLPQR